MIFYLLLPVFSLLLLTIQITVFDIFFLGKIAPEISLILVIYAGFYLGVGRGSALSVVLGFFMDCMTGVVPGLFVFIYLLIFLISSVISLRVYAGGAIFTASFTYVCVLFEGALITLMYNIVYGMNVLYDMLNISVFQAVVTGVLAPVFFVLFRRLEVWLSVWESRSSGEL
jgi:rod shape-determining protein MreD